MELSGMSWQPASELQSVNRMHRLAPKRFVCKKRYMKLLKRGEIVGREDDKYYWQKSVKVHNYQIQNLGISVDWSVIRRIQIELGSHIK